MFAREVDPCATSGRWIEKLVTNRCYHRIMREWGVLALILVLASVPSAAASEPAPEGDCKLGGDSSVVRIVTHCVEYILTGKHCSRIDVLCD